MINVENKNRFCWQDSNTDSGQLLTEVNN